MAEEKKDRWVMGVAVTTTVLAVCAAICSLRAGAFSTKIQICTTKEANSWAYYQSKSIKEHSYELQRDAFKVYRLLGEGNTEARAFIEDKVKTYEAEISRYEKEREQIKKDSRGSHRPAGGAETPQRELCPGGDAPADRHPHVVGFRSHQEEGHVVRGVGLWSVRTRLHEQRVLPLLLSSEGRTTVRVPMLWLCLNSPGDLSA